MPVCRWLNARSELRTNLENALCALCPSVDSAIPIHWLMITFISALEHTRNVMCRGPNIVQTQKFLVIKNAKRIFLRCRTVPSSGKSEATFLFCFQCSHRDVVVVGIVFVGFIAEQNIWKCNKSKLLFTFGGTRWVIPEGCQELNKKIFHTRKVKRRPSALQTMKRSHTRTHHPTHTLTNSSFLI